MSVPSPGPAAWLLRLLWLLAPVLIGPALADALDPRSRAVQLVGSGLAWGLWGVALVAVLVPRTATLTLVRAVVPGAAAVATWSALGAERPAWAAVGLGAGLLAVLALAGPGLSDAFVDGSSYGRERRVALRVPAALLAGPVPLAWAAVAAGTVAGPLLLASRQWAWGAGAIVLGAISAAVGVRQLHLLSRRWLVFVPAGVVIHDPLTLTEPVLFARHLVARIGPAPAEAADATTLDVTAGALGLVLEIRSSEPFSAGVRAGRDRTERDGVTALLVTPTRPAAVVDLAADHRLPVG